MPAAIHFPVEGCPGKAASCTNLRIHFMHRNLEYTILVLTKGPGRHPWYQKLNMFRTGEKMSARYLGTAI